MKISDSEWLEIALELECYHAIFSKIWHMGKPVFSNEIDTAAVKFNKDGQFIEFVFNSNFYQTLDLKNKLFVICHEALHLLLNHGLRGKDTENRNAANAAMDIVVNHLLVNKFGFIREKIKNQEQYCWIDTVFKKRKNVSSDQSFEYYYNLFEKVYGDGMPGEGVGEGQPQMVDDHKFLDSANNSDIQKQIAEKIKKELSEEEIKAIKNSLDKHKNSTDAGRSGGSWFDIIIQKPKKKLKWQNVIKKWELLEKNRDSFVDLEQWARINRRMVCLPQENFLPTSQEIIERDYEKNKIDVFFYIDTSGSCISYKDKFFNVACSLDKKYFDVRIFSFDTHIEEFNSASGNKFYGGGGTSFCVLEDHIQNMLINHDIKKYPSAVFVVTDGYASDHIKPQYPQKWHWFLTEYSTDATIPKQCKIFKLKEYE